MSVTRRVLLHGRWFAVLLGATPAASAQPGGACAVAVAEAATVMGTRAGEAEAPVVSGRITICTIRSADRKAQFTMTLDASPNPAQGLMMQAMIAERAEDTKDTYRKEPALGVNAFSLIEKDKVFLAVPGAARVITVQLGKDAGITPADVERVRAFARKVQALR